jgi:serine/threonine protein kinase
LRLLEHLHGAGVIHNDLEKPENWLVTPDGGAAIVDFQVAMRFAGSGSCLFRLGAREDVRHLLKNKRRFCAQGLTAEERSVVERKSGLARFNARFVKPLYRFVTRRLLGTSDRERSAGSR